MEFLAGIIRIHSCAIDCLTVVGHGVLPPWYLLENGCKAALVVVDIISFPCTQKRGQNRRGGKGGQEVAFSF